MYLARALHAFLFLTLLTVSVHADIIVDGDTIVEEKAAFHDTHYIVPNEYKPHLFSPLLSSKNPGGVLISLGTFRAIQNASQGDFAYAFLFDYNSTTHAFNEAHLDLIKKADDRFHYLELLFFKKNAASLIKQVRAGEISDENFFKELIQLPPLEKSKHTPEQRKLQASIAEYSFGRDQINWTYFISTLDASMSAFTKWTMHPNAWKKLYFGTDQAFARLKDMVYYRRIIPLSGDLTGVEALPSLTSWLNKRGLKLSAMDISNALEYFYKEDAEGDMDPEHMLKIQKFMKNLSSLPFSSDGSLFLTTPRNDCFDTRWTNPISLPNQTVYDNWLYFSIPQQLIKHWLLQGRFSSSVRLRHELESLMKNRIKQPAGSEALITSIDACAQNLLQ